MGSLEYISPDANVVAGFVVRDPVKLVDDLLGVLETVSPDLRKNLDKQQADRGLDIRKDIAAPLGGEFAFAIDGPILPTPSWKMVFEVNDSAHLQQTLERIVGEINKEAAKFGKTGLVWDRAEIGGRTYYTLKSADFGVEVNYTYVNGYVVMGPSRAMVERSVRAQEQGYTLLRSSRFTAGLPSDGNANFSALFYHNLAPLVQPFAERIASSAGNLPQEQQQAIKAMAADMPPTLAYAYAQGDSITFAANTEGGPFGLSPATLLGVPNSLEIQHILQQGMQGRSRTGIPALSWQRLGCGSCDSRTSAAQCPSNGSLAIERNSVMISIQRNLRRRWHWRCAGWLHSFSRRPALIGKLFRLARTRSPSRVMDFEKKLHVNEQGSRADALNTQASAPTGKGLKVSITGDKITVNGVDAGKLRPAIPC